MRSFAIFSVLAAAFTAVSAVTPPVGDPKGNAIIKPALLEIVPVGKPYTITWIPDTPGTVSLLLLRGPATNVVPIGAPIAEGIENSGTFTWTPGPELEPDTERYGIQLIVDATGQYQFSTQFGISNENYTGGKTSTTTGSATVTPTSIGTNTTTSATESTYPTSTEVEETTTKTTEPTTTKAPSTTEKPTTEVPTSVSTTLITSVKPGNTTVPVPTKPTKPTNTSSPESPVETGAASSMVLSLGMGLISVAVAGFALL